jgi:glycosyltransferase involved in cell wall biosynthesis
MKPRSCAGSSLRAERLRSSMKILLAVHHFLPRYSAGAELYTFRLARWLLDHGHAAEVVCIESLDEERPAGVQAERDEYGGVPVWRLHLGLQGAPPDWSYANPFVADWVADRMRADRPDLLHLHSGYLIGAGVLEAAHAQGIPSVVTLHDYWFLCPRITLLRGDGKVCDPIPSDPAGCAWCLRLDQRRHRLPDRLSGGAAGRTWIALAGSAARDQQASRRNYLRRALGLSTLMLAPSQFLAERYGEIVAQNAIHVFRLGIDSARLATTLPPAASPTLRLAYIGQIAEHKGVHVLIDAIRRLPKTGRPVELTIHGNLASFPAYVNQLKTQIGADLRIRLAGPFANDQAVHVFGNTDAVVVPSIWYENSPLAILEAHAAGRAVITSALGGMAELVHDEVDGLHFRPGDPGDLARQIQRLRDEPELLERLSAGVRPPASVDDEMVELMAAYQQLAARSSALAIGEAA